MQRPGSSVGGGVGQIALYATCTKYHRNHIFSPVQLPRQLLAPEHCQSLFQESVEGKDSRRHKTQDYGFVHYRFKHGGVPLVGRFHEPSNWL